MFKVNQLKSNSLPLGRHPRSHDANNYLSLPNRLDALLYSYFAEGGHFFYNQVEKVTNYGCWCQLSKPEGIWTRTKPGLI